MCTLLTKMSDFLLWDEMYLKTCPTILGFGAYDITCCSPMRQMTAKMTNTNTRSLNPPLGDGCGLYFCAPGTFCAPLYLESDQSDFLQGNCNDIWSTAETKEMPQ